MVFTINNITALQNCNPAQYNSAGFLVEMVVADAGIFLKCGIWVNSYLTHLFWIAAVQTEAAR